jgi:3',5'-cyclic AMP phosphodiesterase CpdA
MIIVQISDLHIGAPGQLAFGRIDTAACLARCISSILTLQPRPDMVVASGDLVNAGAPEEYRHLRELLTPLPLPLYLMPGNHDERSALRTEFSDHRYLPFRGTLHYTVDTEEMRLLMLDTVVAGEDGGAFDAPQLDWLETTLDAAPDRPSLIFMHHPPIKIGISYMDDIALGADDAAKLGALSARYRIERISCGHVHRIVTAPWAGTVVGICPSTAFQYILDLRSEAVPTVTGERPAYQVHYWNGTELVTHTVQVQTNDKVATGDRR